jgi:hypothetical protein
MATETEQLFIALRAEISGFEKAMNRAESKGVATYQKLQDGSFKATTAMEKRMQSTAEAMGRSLESIFGANKEWASRGAMNADFKAFVQSKAAVDALRASIDPLFAASKRYEAAVVELDQALARGVLTEQQHAAELQRVGAAMLSTGEKVGTHTGMLGALGNMSNATRAKIQGVGFQVQDFAVQVAGGTSATTAMSQQLPQLLGNFGLVGIAVGTLASIGLPLLGAAFGSTGDSAKSLDTAMSDLRNSVQAINDTAANYTVQGLQALKDKYGEIDQSVLTLIEHQRQYASDKAEATAVASVQALAAQYGALNINLDAVGRAAQSSQLAVMNMGKELGLTSDQARALVAAMQDAANATTFEARSAALGRVADLLQQSTAKANDLTGAVIESEAALRELASAVPAANWLSAALTGAEDLVNKLWEGVRAKAALADTGPGMDQGTPLFEQGYNGIGLSGDALLPGAVKPKGRSGSAGGKGGTSSKIDALLQDLQSQREITEAWYAESLTTLNSATEAQLSAIGGRHAAIERLEAEHQARLSGIRDGSDTGALANAETFFGAMATLTAAGGSKLVKIQRATAAAEALINTLRAQAAVLATPGLTVWGRFAAYAAIGAAGMGLVSALGGGGKAGGSTGGSAKASSAATSSAPAQQAADPLLITMKGVDPKQSYSGQAIIDLATALQKEFGKRGLQLGFVQ